MSACADMACCVMVAERGEQRIQRQQDIMTAIAAKMERYKNPWQELKLLYGANKGKAYTGAAHSLCTLYFPHSI